MLGVIDILYKIHKPFEIPSKLMSSFSFLMLHKLTFDGECCTNMQLCPVVSKPHFIEAIKTFFLKCTNMFCNKPTVLNNLGSVLSLWTPFCLCRSIASTGRASIKSVSAASCPALCSPPKELPLICLPQDCMFAPDHCHVDTILKLIVTVQEP